ncbi:hypothetical protein R1sor_010073 [Riccia sorocarpa]|uniref:Uncharacterized protein n=1 Tax=Riccia sorocarpa TaxID=122646 RepID=A0ABD3I0L4_9MARC
MVELGSRKKLSKVRALKSSNSDEESTDTDEYKEPTNLDRRSRAETHKNTQTSTPSTLHKRLEEGCARYEARKEGGGRNTTTLDSLQVIGSFSPGAGFRSWSGKNGIVSRGKPRAQRRQRTAAPPKTLPNITFSTRTIGEQSVERTSQPTRTKKRRCETNSREVNSEPLLDLNLPTPGGLRTARSE